MFPMIMLFYHLVCALLSLLLLAQEYYDLHACFGLIAAEILRETIQRHQDELTDCLHMRQGLVAHWE